MNNYHLMKNRIIVGFYLIALLTSCSVHKNVTGKYRSNFAQFGFFSTQIILKPNKQFHYIFSGDLQHTELDGTYKTRANKLYLRFDKLKHEPDSGAIKIVEKDTIVDMEKLLNTHSYELKNENGVEYHSKYKISKDKLRPYRIDNKRLVRRGKIYSNRRKFIIFGKKNYSKKYYLKKIEG